jgi:hypothetical protein
MLRHLHARCGMLPEGCGLGQPGTQLVCSTNAIGLIIDTLNAAAQVA